MPAWERNGVDLEWRAGMEKISEELEDEKL